MTRCVVQKLLPSVARPALLRPVGPQASSGKLPGLPRAPPLGELAGASPTERASRLSQSRCTAISRLFVRAILSQCKSCLSASLPSPSSQAMPLPGLRLPASASLPLASCWPRPQQLLPVSATGGGRRRCSQRESLWRVGQVLSGRTKSNLSETLVPRYRGQQLRNMRFRSSCCYSW